MSRMQAVYTYEVKLSHLATLILHLIEIVLKIIQAKKADMITYRYISTKCEHIVQYNCMGYQIFKIKSCSEIFIKCHFQT